MRKIDKEESAVASPDRPVGELQEKAQALADLAVRDGLQGAPTLGRIRQNLHYDENSCVISIDTRAKNVIFFNIMKIEEIGLFLAERRKSLKVSQRDLATLSGVSEHALVNLERGIGNPTLKLVNAVADALGLELRLCVKAQEAT